MGQRNNPYLLLLIGLAITFVIAGIVLALGKAPALVPYQPAVIWLVFIGFAAATCGPNKYVQIPGWGLMTIAAGLRFPIFFSVIKGAVPDPVSGSTPMIAAYVIWACAISLKILSPRFHWNAPGRTIMVVTLVQVMVGVVVQTLMAAV